LKHPLSNDHPHTGTPLNSFPAVTPAEVQKLLSSSSLKFSPLDAFPSLVIKSCPRSFSHIISNLANLSFSQGQFPELYKIAQITPLLKKPNLNPDDVANYRPISNLHTLSKILERLALARLQPFILSSGNFNFLQSAYRKYHSTETCILKTLSDIYKSVDSGSSTLLVSLDLSAAFDTVSHDILLQRLKLSFGISGTALSWITSYLSSRSQYVCIAGHKSPTMPLLSGVPQGSVLGPLLFTVYTSPVSQLVSSFGLSHQQYADDTQIYITVHKQNHTTSLTCIESCLSSLRLWYAQNGMCINPSKSDCLLLSTTNRLHNLRTSGLSSISVSGTPVPLSDTITTLGTTIDSSLSMSQQVRSTTKACLFHLRSIKHIRHLLAEKDAALLAVAMIQSKLDYCNSMLYNTSKANIQSLQRIQNNLARLVIQPPVPTQSSTLLRQLHWLPVQHRITYKIACLTHTTLHVKQPSYLHKLLQPYQPTRSLRSSNHHLLIVPRTHLRLTDRSFHIAAPTIWNSLPGNVKCIRETKKFRTSLKTHLFNSPLK